MIRFAVRKPWQNLKSVSSTGKTFMSSDHGISFRELGAMVTNMAPNPIKLPARILPGPIVEYKGYRVDAKGVTNGSWNMMNKQFQSRSTLSRPAILPIGVDVAPHKAEDLRNALRDAGVREVHLQTLAKVPAQDQQWMAGIRNAARDGINFLFIILSDRNTQLYASIKSYADRMVGIHTVCVINPKFRSASPSYFANLALKVNLKVGGDNHTIAAGTFDHLHLLRQGNTMVVGIDVTHPSSTSDSAAPSVAGMVATVDSGLGQWPGILRAQSAREEMVTDLQMMLESRLHLWKAKNKTYPKNILVYRDGVSDGQYAKVVLVELTRLKAACQKLYPQDGLQMPRMTLVVVGKRHNTRFYPVEGKGKQDKNGNTVPGLVVDQTVTEYGHWDFYLQSHAAIQGTARPAHYIVLHDEIFRQSNWPKMSATEMLQLTTHGLCHMFGRATKGVSYCTPAYYADILCERGRKYLANVFRDDAEINNASNANQTGPSQAQVRNYQAELTIHENIRDSMFYL
ncbi:ribonuclease H-like domain-containing protein [Xylariaceae sp. FL0594]|nr:ribonuclease H-like domain-containing protein [Xylariaceae sp. FL0594]